VTADSPAADRSLQDLRLKQNTVQVLAIERGATFVPAPRGEDVVQPRDRLVVFGKEDSIDRLFEPVAGGDLLVVEDPDDATLLPPEAPAA
jgi:uncharacterized protein with PhoU and TrkA domain